MDLKHIQTELEKIRQEMHDINMKIDHVIHTMDGTYWRS